MTLAERIGRAHILYLSLLPAAGTVALLGFLDLRIFPLLVLVVGTAAVGIYLAVTASYFRTSKNTFAGIVALLDGPVFAVATAFLGGSAAEAIFNDFIIEVLSILLAVMFIVFTSGIPTEKQRFASFIAVGIPLLGTLMVMGMYVAKYLTPHPIQIAVLAAAILQGALWQWRLSHEMEVQREAETYILIGIVAWLASLFVGYGLSTMS